MYCICMCVYCICMYIRTLYILYMHVCTYRDVYMYTVYVLCMHMYFLLLQALLDALKNKSASLHTPYADALNRKCSQEEMRMEMEVLRQQV